MGIDAVDRVPYQCLVRVLAFESSHREDAVIYRAGFSNASQRHQGDSVLHQEWCVKLPIRSLAFSASSRSSESFRRISM